MADRTTKLLLGAIALGLWLNLLSVWFKPVPVAAATQDAATAALLNTQQAVSQIARGTCANLKICGAP